MTFIGFDEPEVWKSIFYKDHKTDYEISTYGQVRNSRTESILKQHVQNNGYYGFTISVKGKLHSFKTARVVASTFIYNDDPEKKTQVNHIDGCKFNNSIYNLEWCTPSENQRHSIKTGLRTDEHSTKYDYDTIICVCTLLQNNYTVSDINKTTGVKKKTIYDILYGISYIDISTNFDFSNRTTAKSGPKTKYSDDIIHDICKSWSDGESCKEISNCLNIPENTIYGIIFGHKKQYTHIVSQYKFDRSKREKYKHKKYTNEQIHLVCKLLEDNTPVYKISDISKVSARIVYKIKNKTIHQSISKNYNI